MASTCLARGGCLDIDATSIVHANTTLKRHRYWPQLDKDFLERLAMNKRPERELCPPSPYCNPIGDDRDDDDNDVPEHLLDLSWVRRQKYLRSYTFSKKETVVDRKTKKKYDLTKKKDKKANKSDHLEKEGDNKCNDGKCSLLESIFAMVFICVARGSSVG